tara:strand:+ start:241 stop:411 length:171 start_codon:yes stop_codon:yes gene_type:complete
MKPTNRLTELSIKQAKRKEKQYKLTDGEGMYLRVTPMVPSTGNYNTGLMVSKEFFL